VLWCIVDCGGIGLLVTNPLFVTSETESVDYSRIAGDHKRAAGVPFPEATAFAVALRTGG
jgi:hypothetical protein